MINRYSKTRTPALLAGVDHVHIHVLLHSIHVHVAVAKVEVKPSTEYTER